MGLVADFLLLGRLPKMCAAATTVLTLLAIFMFLDDASGQTTEPTELRLHVRLKDGETTSKYRSGRLEISRDQVTWESVCVTSLHNTAAVAACGMLGFSRGEIVANLTYGAGDVNMSAAIFSCARGSTDLNECSEFARDNNYCNTTHAAGLFCYNNTQDVFELRLADGFSAGKIRVGRLEVRLGRLNWRSVCYSSFGQREADTACRELGYKHGEVHFGTMKESSGSGFWMSNLMCPRDPVNSLLDCFRGQFGEHDCLLNEFVSLRCYNSSVRLRTAQFDVLNAGSVELYKDGVGWVEICDDNWDDKDARVVCREMGFVDGKGLCCNQLGENRWGSLSVRSMIRNVSCTGDEDTLSQCPYVPGGDRASCPFDSDSVIEIASVICYDQDSSHVNKDINVRLKPVRGGPTDGTYGMLEIQKEGLWGGVCGPSFGDEEATVACSMLGFKAGRALGEPTNFGEEPAGPVWLNSITCLGNETSLANCTYGRWGLPARVCYEYPFVVCYRNELSVRLGGRKTDQQTFGRVDIAHDGVVGTICSDGWNDVSANIACKTMGYQGGKVLETSVVPQGAGQMYLSGVRCSVGDRTIFQCNNAGWKNKSAECLATSRQAGVTCFQSVRLHPGSHKVGVVTVYSSYLDSWGPVCGKTFDNNAAKVVCRQLGFQNGTALMEGVFGYELGPYSYIGLSCKGNESTLDDCPRNQSITSCIPYSYAYASVSCFDQVETVDEKYKLTAGSASSKQASGILQIHANNTWGYACEQYWTSSDANVICKQMGHAGGVSLRHRGNVDGPFFIMKAGCQGNESRIESCEQRTQPCDFTEPAGVLCYTSPTGAPKLSMRTVGSVPHQGRLVMTVDGVEGRVCADSWDDRDAEVACIQMGYRTGIARRFSPSSGQVYLSNLGCYGDESDLLRCENDGWQQYNDTACNGISGADAGVVCFNNVKLDKGEVGTNYVSGELQLFSNNSWYKTCAAGFDRNDAMVVCRELGFDNTAILASARFHYRVTYVVNLGCHGNEATAVNCSYARGRCSSADNGVRLICFNGSIPLSWSWDIVHGYHGQVGLTHLGIRGVICDDGWTDVEANTLCRQQGYKGGKALGTGHYNGQEEIVWLSHVSCHPTAVRMDQCSYKTNVSRECRERRRSAGVLCYNVSEPQIRLADGGKSYGRVEINYDGTWGTVCDSSWSRYDASTVCRQLGFIDGLAFSNSFYGPGTGPVYLNNMWCRSNDTSLFACPSTGWRDYAECSSHLEDASVQCFQKVRLEPVEHKGAVAMFTTYNYAHICDDGGFDDNAAQVVCRELGYDYGKYLCCSAFGNLPNRMIGIGEVSCTGREEKLENCSMRMPISDASCPRQEYVGVICSNQLPSGAYKVNMSEGQLGKIQVEYYGDLGLVCSNGFDNNDATVACKEAGYDSGIAYRFARGPRYSERREIYWLSNLTCSGNEARLGDCGHTDWGQVPGCADASSAAAFCASGAAQGIDWRLAGGTRTRGRVEVKLNGTWGTVCGLSHDSQTVANLVCREMGFHSGLVLDYNRYGGGSGPVWLGGITCPDDAKSLFDCPMDHPGKQVQTCQTHMYDMAVECFSGVQLVRSFGTGRFTDYGRVEVYSMERNTWLAVCEDSFTDHAADLVCQELGKQYGRLQCCSAMGPASVNFANVTCRAKDTYLSACSMNKSTNLVCPSKRYATVFCSDTRAPENLTVELERGFAGMPLATRYGLRGTICSRNVTDREATVVCRGLGYNNGYMLPRTPHSTDSEDNPMVLSGIKCATGQEADISQCRLGDFRNAVGDCGPTRPTLSVLCMQEDEIKYRLNGGTPTSGRAEIYLNGQWGLISRIGFGSDEASVVCRALGFNSGAPQILRAAGLDQLPVYVSSLLCRGNETSIHQCYGEWSWATNYHFPSSLGTYVRCSRAVSLSRGLTAGTGKVLAHHNTSGWGPVCANSFDDLDAKVVCKELGYEDGKSLCCSAYGYNFDRVVMTDLQCNGSESSIFDCPYRDNQALLGTCDPDNYASVACFSNNVTQAYDLSIAGPSDYSGALAVTYLGIEGRICNDSWDDADARVACRELGFENGVAYSHYRASYSLDEIGGPYWSSDFQCRGTEASLGDCEHTEFGTVQKCDDVHYAGVLCYNNEGVTYRLEAGGANYGRVGVRVNGQWGTVCGTTWTNSNAAVFCRSLGFSDGITRDTSDLERATGTVWKPDPQCRGTETDLHKCLHEGWAETTSNYCLTHNDDAGVFCYANVRLSSVLGTEVNHGAVQIYYNNSWYRVCDEKFDDTTARMMCQELGFVDGVAVCCSAYGGVSMEYDINPNVTVHCDGSEANFTKCVKEEPCNSGFYASAICLESESPSGENTSYTFSFKESDTSFGTVSVKHLGVEGRICSANWTDKDAAVFCRYSGYTSGFAYYHSYRNSYPTEVSVGPYLLSNFNCTGLESDLKDCPHSDRLSLGNCSTHHTAGVACYDESGVQYRLAGGDSSSTGRVEMAIDGKWGTVCRRGFTWRGADVFCRSLNFSSGEIIDGDGFGEGSGPIWLHDIQCGGNETALHRCPHTGFEDSEDGPDGWWFFTRPCSTHDDDVSVVCYGSVKLNRAGESEGAVLVNYTGGYVGVCDDSFTNREASVACRSLRQGYQHGIAIKGSAFGSIGGINISGITCGGSETDILQCSIVDTGTCVSGHYASVLCSVEEVTDTFRMSKDPYSQANSGIIEVNQNGVWGRVCHQGWDDNDADVVCRQLGFKGGVAYLHIYRNRRPMVLRDVKCTGTEASLKDCLYDTTADLDDCPYLGNDAGVICYNGSGIEYRLYPGNSSTPGSKYGRVEVGIDGTWNSVCSWRWTSTEAKVFCANLGYVDGIPEFSEQGLPQIPHIMSGSFCTGNESTIFQCLNTGYNTTYLSGLCRDEAYTSCYSTTVEITDLRLVLENGTVSRTEGRVEVFVKGPDTWGTVCNDYWDDTDATVVCKALGHDYGVAEVSLLHGMGEGNIWLDNVHCEGNETALKDCPHRGIGTHNCVHGEDSGVICKNHTATTPTPTTTTTRTTPVPVTPRPTTTTTSTKGTTTTTRKPSTTTTTTTTTKRTTTTTTTTQRTTIKLQVTTAVKKSTTGVTRRPMDTTTARPKVPETTGKPDKSTPQEGGATAAHTGNTKTVAIIVPIVLIIIIIAVIVGLVVHKLRSRKSIPHQRFTDDVINHSADGSIAVHNQMFDMNPVEQNSDPFTKYMAGDKEITLGSDGNARYSSHNGDGHSGVPDSGFNNPLYSVMKSETTSDAARLDLHDANGHAASNGSHI